MKYIDIIEIDIHPCKRFADQGGVLIFAGAIADYFAIEGVAKSTIAGWVKKYSEECQYIKPQNKNNNNSNEEIRALNKKIKELEKENDFLKKAAAFFAKGID